MPANPDSLDIVNLLKLEWASEGGDAADEAPYSSEIEPTEDAVEVGGVFFHEPSYENKNVSIWPDSGELRFRDANNTGSGKTLSELAAAGSGLTEGQHQALDTLLHWIDESHYTEVTRSSGKVTNITAYTDSGKTEKIREVVITRSGGLVSQIDAIQYASGTENERLTGTVARASGKVSSIDWAYTTP